MSYKEEISMEEVKKLSSLVHRIEIIEKDGIQKGVDAIFHSVGVTKNIYLSSSSKILIHKSDEPEPPTPPTPPTPGGNILLDNNLKDSLNVQYEIISEENHTLRISNGKNISSTNYTIEEDAKFIYNNREYTLVEIGEYAFENCSQLTSISLPKSVTTIQKSAFSKTGLNTIELSNEITSIGDTVFKSCLSITSVKLPIHLQVISDGLFDSCNSLKSVNILNQLKSIGESSFLNCSSLETMDIREADSQISIGTNAFLGATSCTLVITDDQYAFLSSSGRIVNEKIDDAMISGITPPTPSGKYVLLRPSASGSELYYDSRYEDLSPSSTKTFIFTFQAGSLEFIGSYPFDSILPYEVQQDVIFQFESSEGTLENKFLYAINLEVGFAYFKVIPSSVDFIANSYTDVGEIGFVDASGCSTTFLGVDLREIITNFSGSTECTLYLNSDQFMYYTDFGRVITKTSETTGYLTYNTKVIVEVKET